MNENIMFVSIEGGVLQEAFSTVEGLRLVIMDHDNDEKMEEDRVVSWNDLDPKMIERVKIILTTKDTLEGKHVSDIANMVRIQCANGNWNYDPYMLGMANGLIAAYATLMDIKPTFLDAPKVWLSDLQKRKGELK